MHTLDPVRVGVIGLGWAGHRHLRAFSAEPGVMVAAIADPDAGRRSARAREFGVSRTYDDWQAMLMAERLDAVSVATPTVTHAPICEAALGSGCHILCEKPVSMSAREAERMSAAAVAAQRVLDVCFNYRMRADVQSLKRFIDAGFLGEIYSLHGFWTRRTGIPGLKSWYTTGVMSGGGVLLDIGTHILDLMMHLAGEPAITSVSATMSSRFGVRGLGASPRSRRHLKVHDHFDVEDTAVAFFRLFDQRCMTLDVRWASFQAEQDTFGILARGTEGGADLVVVDYADSRTLRVFPPSGDSIVPALEPTDDHREVVRAFLRAVRANDWAANNGKHAIARARLIDTCYESAAAGAELAVRHGSA